MGLMIRPLNLIIQTCAHSISKALSWARPLGISGVKLLLDHLGIRKGQNHRNGLSANACKGLLTHKISACKYEAHSTSLFVCLLVCQNAAETDIVRTTIIVFSSAITDRQEKRGWR
jgi:hypothetical protein